MNDLELIIYPTIGALSNKKSRFCSRLACHPPLIPPAVTLQRPDGAEDDGGTGTRTHLQKSPY